MRDDYMSWLAGIDLTKRILEIGSLESPIIGKAEANVFYAEVRHNEEIRDQATLSAQPEEIVIAEDIVPADFIVSGSYSESLCHAEKFDYIIMYSEMEPFSRFIETVQDLAGILAPDGTLYLFLPDHRFCDDHFRQPTSFAEAFYVHHHNLAHPPWRTLDSILEKAYLNQPDIYWSRTQVASWNLLSPPVTFPEALETVRSLPVDKAAGIRFSVFSPASFLLLLCGMMRSNLLPFRMERFFHTPPGRSHFGVSLAYCPELLHDEGSRGKQISTMTMLADKCTIRHLAGTTETPGQAGSPRHKCGVAATPASRCLEVLGGVPSVFPDEPGNPAGINAFDFDKNPAALPGPFDRVILNRSLERFPRLLDSLEAVSDLLVPGGTLECLVADHRRSRDYFRQPTSFAELWHVRAGQLPLPVWRVLEQRLEECTEDDPVFYWKEETPSRLYQADRPHPGEILDLVQARPKPQRSMRYHVFTPFSFLMLHYDMLRANLARFSLENLSPAKTFESAFRVEFRHTPELTGDSGLRDRELGRVVTLMNGFMPG